jgi:hypothetical protein
MTQKKLTSQAKYEVLSLCTEYVKPQQIKKEFGITYDCLNHYCKEHDIPKWQKSYSQRRKQNEQEFLENEQYEKELRIRLAREELQKYEADTNS